MSINSLVLKNTKGGRLNTVLFCFKDQPCNSYYHLKPKDVNFKDQQLKELEDWEKRIDLDFNSLSSECWSLQGKLIPVEEYEDKQKRFKKLICSKEDIRAFKAMLNAI